MIFSTVLDWTTKLVAAAGALAGAYAFLTDDAAEAVPLVLTLLGLTYEALLPSVALLLLYRELRYWRGPVHRRPSHGYRRLFTKKEPGMTELEILERARLRDQVLTLSFIVVSGAMFFPAAYLMIREDMQRGFPADTWSVTWLMGMLALLVAIFALASMAWVEVRKQRRWRRKRRCENCGEASPAEARICSSCSEPSPRWRLLRP